MSLITFSNIYNPKTMHIYSRAHYFYNMHTLEFTHTFLSFNTAMSHDRPKTDNVSIGSHTQLPKRHIINVPQPLLPTVQYRETSFTVPQTLRTRLQTSKSLSFLKSQSQRKIGKRNRLYKQITVYL